MPRITINLPEKYTFNTSIAVRIGDINRGSHVSNVNMLAIVEEARAQYLISLGYWDEVNHVKDAGFIVGDLGIIYKKQASYGKPIKVEIGPEDIKNKSFDLIFKLSDSSTGEEVALAKTGIVYFDYHTQQVIPLPEEMRRKLLG
jgi:acyl-CoA thioester hydrolase